MKEVQWGGGAGANIDEGAMSNDISLIVYAHPQLLILSRPPPRHSTGEICGVITLASNSRNLSLNSRRALYRLFCPFSSSSCTQGKRNSPKTVHKFLHLLKEPKANACLLDDPSFPLLFSWGV
jgi:hypothetical protein